MLAVKFIFFFALAYRSYGLNDRLSHVTEPEHYVLTVAPNFENASFAGRVDILIHVKTSTSEVILNSKDHNVSSIVVIDDISQQEIPIANHYRHEAQEQLTIELKSTLVTNRKYAVSIQFSGLLNNDMTGLYRSSFQNNSTTEWVAVTQFQPAFARTAFPCYDEPSFKARFNITVGVQSNQTALSHMPEWYRTYEEMDIPETGHRDLIWIHFQQTPPMSTYLVGFVVGDFVVSSSNSSFFKVYSRAEYSDQMDYALNIAPKLLEALVNFTDVDFELPKIDIVAVPDINGAVDSWGMNVYREDRIFISDDCTTKTARSVTGLMHHVLSHYWFGNLVSCAWWDDLWLNEGFATFMEYFLTATTVPDWRLDEFFLVEQHQMALAYDQTPRHPLTVNLSVFQDVDIFDTITYSKAATVLKMLRDVVGEKVFKTALNIYLSENQYRTVEPNSLWDAFENALFVDQREFVEGETVNTVMATWTDQCGYPVVHVKRNISSFVLTQERFLVPKGDDNYIPSECFESQGEWYIPLTYTTNSSQNFTDLAPVKWMRPTTNETALPFLEDFDWYIFNVQSTGFYRVNYEDDNWLALIKQLHDSPEAIHVLNRAQLIDDSFNLARAGKLNYSVPFELTKYLKNENDVVPWYSVMNNYDYILDRMRRSHVYPDIKNYVRDLSGIIYNKLENLVLKHNNDYDINASWNAFSLWACKLDNVDCKITALSFFQRWQNGQQIPADIKEASFCIGIRTSCTPATWVELFNLYKTSSSNAEKQALLTALTCTRDEQLLYKYLETLFKSEDNAIRPQDYNTVVNAMASTPLGIKVLLNYLQKNVHQFCNEIDNGKYIATSIFKILASKVALDDEVDKIREILLSPGSCQTSEGHSIFHKHINTIDHNLNWFKNYSDVINEYVKPGSATAEPPPSPATSTPQPKIESSAASVNLYFPSLLTSLTLTIVSTVYFI
ncbi:aminopeptidase N-like [Adelges cooleyi]|uniref:aminopeptidase N-like n=1 Tax=Adelges cooleyi TaxID=133065 RepID=UPI0021809587|nr:aminopeptidase N-like [Adelges cooleyi]